MAVWTRGGDENMTPLVKVHDDWIRGAATEVRIRKVIRDDRLFISKGFTNGQMREVEMNIGRP